MTKTLLCSNEESKAREATLLNCLTSGEEEEVARVVASDQHPGQECDMAKLKILLGRTQVDWCNHAEWEVFNKACNSSILPHCSPSLKSEVASLGKVGPRVFTTTDPELASSMRLLKTWTTSSPTPEETFPSTFILTLATFGRAETSRLTKGSQPAHKV